MPELVPPEPRFHHSFLSFVDEIRAAGESDGTAGLWLIPGIPGVEEESVARDELVPASGFARYVERLQSLADEQSELPDGIVHSTHLWWVDGDDVLGRLSVRHRLTPWLRDFGGHIGYVVRPSARGRGHATAMLRAALPWALERGIDQALVTCDDTNVASRKVIEACGGVFEDQREQKLRYWIPIRSS
jgi:predicted acetyltransferase